MSAEVLEHPDGVRGHVVVVERLIGVGGVAVAATVEGDDAEVPTRSAAPIESRRSSLLPRPPCSSTTVRSPLPRVSVQVLTPSMSMNAAMLPPRSVDGCRVASDVTPWSRGVACPSTSSHRTAAVNPRAARGDRA